MTETSAPTRWEELSRYQPREFLSDQVDFNDPAIATALYRKLLEMPIASADDLERFLLYRGELDAAVSQHGSVLYIRMTCQTDDVERAKAYEHFTQTVEPAIKPLVDELNRKYLACREQFTAEGQRYAVYDRNLQADVELFREKNVALEKQEEQLKQKYQALTGAMTVTFQDKEHTLPQMARYLEQTDRTVREAAWRAVEQRRLREKNTLEEIFDALFELRREIAANAGFANYRDYRFKQWHRFDYTPADCRAFHDAVENCVLPLHADILEHRRQKLGQETLRPWDLSVDPAGRDPLRPFEEVNQLIEGSRRIFETIDPELGGQFGELADLQLLDLASRKGKAPGGYQNTLDEVRKPFIFMNAVGTNNDLRVLLHEAGHAFHANACRNEPLLAYRHAPLEFCEVASMSMELLAAPHLGTFYHEEDARRSQCDHLEGVVSVLVWIATIDAFQQMLYESPTATPQVRRDIWRSIHGRFSGRYVDWHGLETERDYLWHRQLHLFLYPFYYIEYGIAQLGALQLWLQAQTDPQAALGRYKQALALGGSRPLPELFAAAGLNFDFSARAVEPLARALREQWLNVR